MALCQMSAGFLVPRQCENVATGMCSTCGSPVCVVHAVMGEAGVQCIVCGTGAGRHFDRDSMYDRSVDEGADSLLDDADEDLFRKIGDDEDDEDVS